MTNEAALLIYEKFVCVSGVEELLDEQCMLPV